MSDAVSVSDVVSMSDVSVRDVSARDVVSVRDVVSGSDVSVRDVVSGSDEVSGSDVVTVNGVMGVALVNDAASTSFCAFSACYWCLQLGDGGGDGGSDFTVLELPRTGLAVCGNKPAECIRPGLSEGEGSIATGSRIATDSIVAGSLTVKDAIGSGSPSVTDAISSGSPSVINAITAAGSSSVIDVIAASGSSSVIDAGLPSRRREFTAVAGCFLLATRAGQFIVLYSCIIDYLT
eukprot:Em0010g111a